LAAEYTTFVDTNVLVYAHDATEAARQPIARVLLDALWAEHSGVLSTQILQEFYNTTTRKLTLPMTRAEAREIVDLYSAWPVVVIDPVMILTASRLEEEHQLSFWDALVIEAARVAGAQSLLTEDMQDGGVIEGVRIENPFVAAEQPDKPQVSRG
jgi:predicted nucleic acid-binding protein